MLYFDHNATHPVSSAAREAWLQAVERFPGNPSSPHRLGSRAETALEGARAQLAEWLSCRPEEIVWTSGATEANNLALQHLGRGGGEVWVTSIEHPSVIRAAERFFGGRVRKIPARGSGVGDLGWLAEQLRGAAEPPAAVAWMAANNSGSKDTVQPKTVEIDRMSGTAPATRYRLKGAWPTKLDSVGNESVITIVYQTLEPVT